MERVFSVWGYDSLDAMTFHASVYCLKPKNNKKRVLSK